MKSKLGLVIAAFLAAALFATPNINAATASRSDCTSVYKTYPFGISLNKQSIGTSRAEINRAKYIQLKYLDKDLDGVVCEIEKLQTQIPVTSPIAATNLKVKRTWLASSTASNFLFTWDSLEDYDTQFGTLIYWNATLPNYQYKILATNLKTLTFDFQSTQPICFTILSEIKVSGATTLADAACEDTRTVFTTTTTTTAPRSVTTVNKIITRPTFTTTPRVVISIPPFVPNCFFTTGVIGCSTTTTTTSVSSSLVAASTTTTTLSTTTTTTLPATTTSSTCVPDSYEVSRLNNAIQPWNINYSRIRALFVYEGRTEATRMLDSYIDAMRGRYETAMASVLKCVRVYWEIVDLNSVNWPNR